MGRDIRKFVRPDLAIEFQKRCLAELGIQVSFSSVDRDYKEQTAYFAQGREPLIVVNTLRFSAKLPAISEAENKRKVTWTMNSKHVVNLGDENKVNDVSYAFDFFIVKDGKPVWDVKADIDGDEIPDYLECIRIAESLDLTSGSKFKNPDFPHIQYDGLVSYVGQ